MRAPSALPFWLYTAGVSRADALLAWYDRHSRDLPWRESQDPYRVWVSEIMLQQTRVATVIPYYERFLSRFPDARALAKASIDEVLALWSGLGYYRRARQMHAAARQIVVMDTFPDTLAGLKSLPGIGDYTAAAVGSIAFGIHEPVMDGNVERVLCRYLALAGDPRSRGVRPRLMEAARSFLDPDRPGDSNQAMMELGATICLPQRPSCLLCPLRDSCRAAAEGTWDLYPTPRKRKAPVKVRHLAAWVEREGKVLLFRRPDTSELLAGTWELPWVELPAEDAEGKGGEPEPALYRAANALGKRYGGSWKLSDRLAEARHGITYRSIEVAVHPAKVTGGGELAEGPEAGFFSAEERRELPLSSLVGKVVRAVTKARR